MGSLKEKSNLFLNKMDQTKIKKKYFAKISLIKKYNQAYFDKDSPFVSDKVYDELKLYILNLEKKYIFLRSKDSPSKKVGYTPSSKFKKITHNVPMLSLANAFSLEQIEDFIKKIKNFLNFENVKKVYRKVVRKRLQNS